MSELLPSAALAAFASMLSAAVIVDLRSRRIPNVVSLGGAGVAALLAVLAGGAALLGASALGWLAALALTLPFYAVRVMGAGDVKLIAAVGAFIGLTGALDAVLFSFVAGSVTGIGALLLRDGMRATLSRWGFGLKHLLRGGVWMGARPRAAGEAPLRAPYALAIAAGAAVALLWPLLGDGGLLVGA